MAATSDSPSRSPIVFYDIAMCPPREKTCCSPNPSKTRLALNFKKVPYETSWVQLPDIARVRRGLDVPACRKFADNTDFFTLPVIKDPVTNSLVGDSFDIAVYLQRTYPDSGTGNLFPTQKLDYVFTPEHELLVPLSERQDSDFPDYARFNTNVDAAFTSYAILATQGFPFDPETADQIKAEFVRRAGVTSWDDFALAGQARTDLLNSFRNTLGELSKLFLRDTSGPFILGQQASYADFIVGGWLRMFRITLPENEWEELRSWHTGVFGKLYEALPF